MVISRFQLQVMALNTVTALTVAVLALPSLVVAVFYDSVWMTLLYDGVFVLTTCSVVYLRRRALNALDEASDFE